MSLKSILDARREERRNERAIPEPAPRTDGDPELEAALARVDRGELVKVHRSRHGALVVQHVTAPVGDA